MQWKYFDTKQGTTIINLPADANEYLFVLAFGTSAGRQALSFEFNAPNDSVYINSRSFTSGYYLNNTSYAFGQIFVNCQNHNSNIASVNISGVDYTATSYLTVYYR